MLGGWGSEGERPAFWSWRNLHWHPSPASAELRAHGQVLASLDPSSFICQKRVLVMERGLDRCPIPSVSRSCYLTLDFSMPVFFHVFMTVIGFLWSPLPGPALRGLGAELIGS